MNVISTLIIQLFLVYGNFAIGQKSHLIISQLISIVGMILLPFTVFIPGIPGFILNCIICLLFGFANSLQMISLFKISTYFPEIYRIVISSTTALCGLSVNCIKFMVITLFSNSSYFNKTMILHIYGIIISTIGIICVLVVYKNNEITQAINENSISDILNNHKMVIIF